MLQIGSPGFEYKPSDLSSHIHYMGLVLPYAKKERKELSFLLSLTRCKKRLLVTQGTMENDHSKIIIPTLEAFKNTDYLLIVYTTGNGTEVLRKP